MKELTQEFYTIKEVMKLLRLSRLTIYRYITSNKLKAYKFWLEYRIERIDLEQFLIESIK